MTQNQDQDFLTRLSALDDRLQERLASLHPSRDASTLTLEAFALKQECLLLWDQVDKLEGDVRDLKAEVKKLKEQVEGHIMDRVAMACRLIGINIAHKLTRLCLPGVSISGARGMNVENLKNKKGADIQKLDAYLKQFPMAEKAIKFLSRDNKTVAHPENWINSEGKMELFTEALLGKCIEQRYEGHGMEEEVKEALALLKVLGKDLNEDLVIPF